MLGRNGSTQRHYECFSNFSRSVTYPSGVGSTVALLAELSSLVTGNANPQARGQKILQSGVFQGEGEASSEEVQCCLEDTRSVCFPLCFALC